MAPWVNDISAVEIFVINADGSLIHLDGEEAVIEGDHTVTLINELQNCSVNEIYDAAQCLLNISLNYEDLN